MWKSHDQFILRTVLNLFKQKLKPNQVKTGHYQVSPKKA